MLAPFFQDEGRGGLLLINHWPSSSITDIGKDRSLLVTDGQNRFDFVKADFFLILVKMHLKRKIKFSSKGVFNHKQFKCANLN